MTQYNMTRGFKRQFRSSETTLFLYVGQIFLGLLKYRENFQRCCIDLYFVTFIWLYDYLNMKIYLNMWMYCTFKLTTIDINFLSWLEVNYDLAEVGNSSSATGNCHGQFLQFYNSYNPTIPTKLFSGFFSNYSPDIEIGYKFKLHYNTT